MQWNSLYESDEFSEEGIFREEDKVDGGGAAATARIPAVARANANPRLFMSRKSMLMDR